MTKKQCLKILILLFILLVPIGIIEINARSLKYGAPPYDDGTNESQIETRPFNDYSNWVRPEGPVRIGLQVGHWKTSEMPEELAKIRDRGGGTSGMGMAEWQVVLIIAEKTAELLKNKGYQVDILPATVPKKYWADAFVAIHADGNLNPLVSGYKVAAYQKDRTGKADNLAQLVSENYGKVIDFPLDPNITKNMTRYYAFNFRRYEHAIHPMTPGILIETGFMTNKNEADFLINKPEIVAEGIANGIIQFIEQSGIE